LLFCDAMRILLPVFCVAACASDPTVTFNGTVTEGSAYGASFAATPAAGYPIVGTAVTLCLDGGCSVPYDVGASGQFTVSQEFAGAMGEGADVMLFVSAPDDRSYQYDAAFSDSPAALIPACDVPCTEEFLNITLGPGSGSAQL
jgi:hypothetical protein